MSFNTLRLFSSRLLFSRYHNRFLNTLLCVEHEEGRVSQSTLHTLTASLKLGGDLTCLVAGEEGKETTQVADSVSRLEGVSRVLLAASQLYKQPLAELMADLIVSVHSKFNFSHISMSASSFGKTVIPRVAGMLEVAPISEVTAVKSPDTFVRTVYASNAIVTLTALDSLKLFTVRSTAFPAALQQDSSAPVESIASPGTPQSGSEWRGHTLSASERPDLSSAKIVISGGRGLKSGDNFELLYRLADKMGAAVGASRAAVDAGFVPNELQVGQTGKIVAPELYIAVGISGAIQHLAGMKDSKTIVAINKDPDAPIFQVADHGLVADLFKAVPELTDMF